MLSCLPASRPVTHAVSLPEALRGLGALGERPALVSGAEALRLATRERLGLLQASSFWQALLDPTLALDDYGALLLQLSSVWTPISRSLRERAEGLDRLAWLPAPGTARLQADLACLRRHGVMLPSMPPRRTDLPRGDTAHLMGMVTMVRLMQMSCVQVAHHVDARLSLQGEGRRFFLDPAGSVEVQRAEWAAWRRVLDAELRTRNDCESAIRGACGLVDLLQNRLSDALLVA